MRPITLFRALAWFGVVVVFWSLNIQWGTDIDAGNGPPTVWHRTVVGAGLLSFIVALILSIAGRKGNPPGWPARIAATAGAALVLFLGWRLHGQADGPYTDAIAGPGWTWLMVGGALLAGAVIGTMGLKAPRAKAAGSKGGGKRR
jgi:hypothetical protein